MNYTRTRRWIIGVLFILLLGIPYQGHADSRPTTLTVMPFTALQGQSEAWLSKGLADLFTKNLGQVDSFVLLERTRMQAFVDELELSQSGLIDKNQALRMGRVARVEQVLYGNYSLSGGEIRLNVFLLETDSQEIVQTAQASGKLKKIRDLAQQLSLDLIKNQGVKLSREERKKIRFVATDSIKATEHFYTGMDLCDRGQYPDAFGRFFAASKKDPNYWEAHLWMGRLLEAQTQVRESIVTYKKLFKKAPAVVEAQDAMMFAGLAAENRLHDSGRAIEIYKTLSAKKPQTPHNIEALFRLGGLLAEKRQYGEAYRALQQVVDFHKKYSKGLRQRVGLRNSSYFSWRHASTLHWDTVRQMIALYPDLTAALPRKQWPPLPTGAYLMDPKNPVIKSRMKDMKPFFKDVRPGWKEYYYAVVIPNGFEFTGVEMEATGKVFRRGMSGGQSGDDFRIRVHPFPLARDVHSSWIGALYGQTLKTTTLRKGVTFHGENRKIIVVEVGAAGAQLDGWGLKGYIRKRGKKDQISPPLTAQIGKNPEALHLNTIPFLSGKFSGSNRENHFYTPKKELAVAMDRSGRIGLVTLSGALDDAESDLWFSQSKDGITWEAPFRLPINSSSQEYNPHLVSAEDGSLQLFWISKRRGQGWELWTSKLSKNDKWSHPSRVVLETIEPWKPTSIHMAQKTKSSAKGLIKSLFSNEPKSRNSKFKEFSRVGIPRFLEYSVTQNRRGQWVLAYYSYVTNGVVILQSTNLKDWKKISKINTRNPVFGPSLIQDSKGVYRLALFANNGRPQVYSSNQARRWSKKEYSLKCYCEQYSNEVHSMQLIPKPDGRLTLLLSDNFYGLQYANFDPDSDKPQLDLVSRVRTEPYAITPFKNGKYLVALKEDRGVGIYQYKNFTTSSENSGNGIIYTETTQDSSDNRWERIFAHRRFISSDVTALAIGPKGRIWWGIESGLMTLNGEVFALQDVSNGFFHNFVTNIAPCSDSHAWVSSSFHEHPEVGRVSVNPKEYRSFMPLKTTRVRIPDARGAISVIKCAKNKGLLVGTTEGQFIRFKNGRAVAKYQFSSAVTAIAENGHGKYSVGTGSGEVHFVQNDISVKAKSFKGQVNDLVVDAQGDLWAAVEGEGLGRYQKGKWKTFSTKSSKVAYDRIGTLTADKSKGVWYVAHGERRSFGVGFFDGKEHGLYNPPQRFIDKPSSLDIGPKGRVWIGTWFDGVYQLVKNK
jgi:tetratricopeptide (TPR) repeat protein